MDYKQSFVLSSHVKTLSMMTRRGCPSPKMSVKCRICKKKTEKSRHYLHFCPLINVKSEQNRNFRKFSAVNRKLHHTAESTSRSAIIERV